MQANLSACFAATMGWEGGNTVSLNPKDPGNWTGGRIGEGILAGTVWGVSAPVAVAKGWAPGAVTMDEAQSLFKSDYWDACGCGLLPDGLDHCVSDMAYNAGVHRAKDLLTQIDRNASIADQIAQYTQARLAFLQSLNTWASFGSGWRKRCLGVQATACVMAGVPVPAQAKSYAPHIAVAGGAVAAGGALAAGVPPIVILVVMAVAIAIAFLIIKSKQK